MSTGTQTLKRMGAAMVAAAVGAAMVVSVASAQAPPNPPSRFVGQVTVNGTAAAAGTVVEARIGGATCGTSTVFMANSQARYAVDAAALDPVGAPGCGTEGATVEFLVGGQKAAETGSWANYQLNTVNLTVGAQASPTPPPAATPTRTPAPPVAGNFDGGGGSSPNVPLLEVLLVATAIGLGGVALAARARRS